MFIRSTTLLLAFTAIHVNAQTGSTIIEQDPSGACTVCFTAGEEPVLEPEPPIPYGGPYPVTCSSIVSAVASTTSLQGSEECKNNQLAAYQMGCCKDPPFYYCSICPDGSDFVRSNLVPQGLGSNPTCAEYEITKNSYASSFTTGKCEDTFLQRGAHYCGCPDVEQACTLCPDGQAATNPERGEAWVTGMRCEGLEYFFSLFKDFECNGQRDAFGVDFAHFCKCSDYERPEDIGTCVMCPEGIENSDFIHMTTPFERTCADSADFALSITRENICLSEMGEVIAAGCKCKNGAGPVFKEPGEKSSDSGPIVMTSPRDVSMAIVVVLALNGLLA